MADLICRCEKLCSNYDDYFANHVDNISSWGEQVEMDERVSDNRQDIEKMLRDEPFARRRRAERDRKIAAGYVPKPPQPRPAEKGPKPVCRKCIVDSNGKIIANNCCNKKCTFNHGPFDRRENVKNNY